jgi:alkaline phosphatase D
MTTITLAEATNLIAAVGAQHTVLVQGEMGCGKSSMLTELKRRYPDHHPAYFDLTTKDVGDFMIPAVTDGVAEFLPNAEFGIHTDKPVLLMLDELGKASKSVMNACLRVMLERTVGTQKLPEGSIVFATTNLAQEGLGDSMPPHARNRIVTVQISKPTADEWIAWAMGNDVEPVVLATVNEFPQMLSSYTEYDTPNANHYINDPRAQRAAFVTPRSLYAASNIIKQTRHLPETVLFAALCGTIGAPAASDMLAVLRLDAELPSWKEIIADPNMAKAPTNGAALAMLIYRAIVRVDADSFDNWLIYLGRLSREAQALFARQIMTPSSGKLKLAATNRSMVKLCSELNYLFK